MTNETILARLTAVRKQFGGWHAEALLVTDEINRRWVSDFTGSAGILLITEKHAYLATDFRYWEQAEQQAPDFSLVKITNQQEDLAKFLADAGISQIGFEADQVTVAKREKLGGIDGIDWLPLEEPFKSLRQVKTEGELDKIQAAAGIADKAMVAFPHIARPGVTEKEAAWELEKMMRESGADDTAFDIIVASGANAALPHHRPGDRQMAVGDPIVVDLGAKLDGYHSDLTRSFYLGSQPSAKYWEIYNVTAKAHQAAVAGIRAGVSGQEADALARDIIATAGYEERFGHSLGHGVGLEIHEYPALSGRNEEKLPAGAVVTIEPGIYVPGWGGVRIEDLAVVTQNGTRLLSACPKEPIISTT